MSQPTDAIIQAVSPATPIIQTRQVHLQCGGKIACTATSTVRITSPECARLFLQEKYAIGQMFRRLEKVPAFELLKVGLGPVTRDGKSERIPSTNSDHPVSYGDERIQLWRKYTLVIPDFECEILEVFPAREMFVNPEKWLSGRPTTPQGTGALTQLKTGGKLWFQQGAKAALAISLCLVVALEVSMYRSGRFATC